MELEVFAIHMNGQELDESVLKQIGWEMPYHIFFILHMSLKARQ